MPDRAKTVFDKKVEQIDVGPEDRLFVLTGAGISAESGLATFRGNGGLWRGHHPEDVATPEAWGRDPAMVWAFYVERRQRAAGARPNAAHLALAELERRLGDRMLICTQNVDSLHEQAGSQRVLHLHGELFKNRCESCGEVCDDAALPANGSLPQCNKCGGRLRPNVCWFGELPFCLPETYRAMKACTVFVTIGSSGLVQPAASFPWEARQHRARVYYIGAERPANAIYFDQLFLGKAGEVVPRAFAI